MQFTSIYDDLKWWTGPSKPQHLRARARLFRSGFASTVRKERGRKAHLAGGRQSQHLRRLHLFPARRGIRPSVSWFYPSPFPVEWWLNPRGTGGSAYGHPAYRGPGRVLDKLRNFVYRCFFTQKRKRKRFAKVGSTKNPINILGNPIKEMEQPANNMDLVYFIVIYYILRQKWQKIVFCFYHYKLWRFA